MSVVIRDFEVVPAAAPPQNQHQSENGNQKDQPSAKSPEMTRQVERQVRRLILRNLRIRAY